MGDDAKAMAPTVPETQEDLASLPVGTIGRFAIESVLGAGGMGIVFVARDPVLDRRIAVKLIRGSSARAEVRLLREAQALARLTHPNVVTVHEAGTADGSVYIAMELVDGTSLRSWLERPHPWREVLAMFIAAGRGLAAAHDAGLVHRDFKPENVFVDRGGAIKVGDFGLVGVVGEGGEPPDSPASPLETSVTRTGNVMGTPAYMAPEQLRGEVVDERADQYAFCKSLADGLADQPKPAWLAQAIARGCSERPADRWPSMAALLAALERAPRRRRAIVLGVGAAAVIAGAVTIGAFVTHGDGGVSCDSARSASSSVWGPATRDQIVIGFASTKLGWAPEAATRAVGGIDRWVARWGDVRVQACKATHQHGEQSTELLDKRVACLDRELTGLGALATALAHPDALAVENAASAIDTLPAPEACTAERVAGVAPVTAVAASVDRAISAAETAFRLRRADVVPLADAALAAAQEIGDPGARARALSVHARAIAGTDAARARRELDDAQTAAAAARDPGLEADVVLAAIRVSADQDAVDRIEALVPVARAAVERAGSPPPLERELANAELFAATRAGKLEDARAACTRATELALAEDRVRVGTACQCRIALAARDPKTSVPLCEADVAATRADVGPVHPETQKALHNWVAAMANAGQLQDAATHAAELTVLVGQLYGERSFEMAIHLKLVARIESGQTKIAASRATLERALALLDEVKPDAPERGLILLDLSKEAQVLGDIAGAIKYAEEGRIASERSLGPDNVEMASVWMLHANAVGADPAQRTRAIGSWQRAIAIAEKAPAGSTWILGSVLSQYAYRLAQWDRFDDSIPIARRAIGIFDSIGDARAAGRTRQLIGEMQVGLGRKAEARTILREARKLLAPLEGEADSVEEIDKLLARAR